MTSPPGGDAAPRPGKEGGAEPNESESHKNSSPNLAEALRLAALGWHVFPCHTPVFAAPGTPPTCSCRTPDCTDIGKHPRTPNGLKDATTDAAVVTAWWTKWPGANVAVRTGPESGIVVLDVDPRHGGDVTLAEQEGKHGKLPDTVTALTGGGGRHLAFQHPGDYVKSRNLLAGLDCRGDGGYIIVEPSLHASGKRYAWELSSRPAGVPLAPLPAWLFKLMVEPPRKTTPAGGDGGAAIPEGKRNEALTSLAGSMRRRGMNFEEILVALRAVNSGRCQPPLDDAEAEKIARSVARYAPASSDGVPWSPPAPLFDGPVPPPFPLREAFPLRLDRIAGFCEGLAEELQVPVDLPAMLLLPIVALGLSQKFTIEIRPGWREVSALWTNTLLDSGERKSAALRRMTDPVLEWERDELERIRPDLAAAQEERDLLERELQDVRKKAAKGDSEARARAIEIAQELAEMKPPVLPTLVTTDATSEALVGLMLTNGERALVSSPEADALDVMMGRYDEKARPNFGVWLKGYSGDRVRVHRRGRPPEYLDRPTLNVALSVQPEAVRGLFSSRAAHGRGFLARFFWTVPVGMIGHRKIGAEPVPEHLEMAYVTAVRRMLDLPLDPKMGPRVVRLSPDAAAMFRTFEERVEHELARGRSLAEHRAWGAKLCGGIARITLVLHCLEVFGLGSAGSAGSALEVNGATMRAGLAWAPYLIEHEKIATGITGCDPQVVVADRVLNWLERAGLDTFTRRECFTAIRGPFVRVVEDVDDGLKLLVELGYLRTVPPPPHGEQGGRPPSPGYLVNPLWDRGAER